MTAEQLKQMSDEIEKRLRNEAEFGSSCRGNLMDAAAAALAAQRTLITRLISQSAAQEVLIGEHIAKQREAEAQRDAALGMVRRLVHEFGDYHYHTCPADRLPDPGECECFAGALMNDARAALAATEGEGHE